MYDTVNSDPLDKKLSGSEPTTNSLTAAGGKDNNTAELNKKEETDLKDETEEEVKESFSDEDVPVEPVVGNDGIEVGGEG